jgi:hypothetical protein
MIAGSDTAPGFLLFNGFDNDELGEYNKNLLRSVI